MRSLHGAPNLSKASPLLPAPRVQLSNAETLGAYVFGAGAGARKLPIARGFEADVVGESAARLKAIVGEHAGWLAGNCARQVASYRRARARAPAACYGPTESPSCTRL